MCLHLFHTSHRDFRASNIHELPLRWQLKNLNLYNIEGKLRVRIDMLSHQYGTHAYYMHVNEFFM